MTSHLKGQPLSTLTLFTTHSPIYAHCKETQITFAH